MGHRQAHNPEVGATQQAAWTLGQMGRDARLALPRLRQLAAGPNPGYARWACEAVHRIEAEVARDIDPAQAYDELAADDCLVSIRALWRMAEMGAPAAKVIKDRLAKDDTPRLPGVRLRQQARARQVLAVLAPAPETQGQQGDALRPPASHQRSRGDAP